MVNLPWEKAANFKAGHQVVSLAVGLQLDVNRFLQVTQGPQPDFATET